MVSITLVSLNVHSGKFLKSYLSVGLYKIPIRTGLDLGKKNIYKNIPCVNVEIRFLVIQFSTLRRINLMYSMCHCIT